MSVFRKRQLGGLVRCDSLMMYLAPWTHHLCGLFLWSHLLPFCSNIVLFPLSFCALTLNNWCQLVSAS